MNKNYGDPHILELLRTSSCSVPGLLCHCFTWWFHLFSWWMIRPLCTQTLVINAVCSSASSWWNMQGLPWKRCLDKSMCYSKTCIYLLALIMPFQICKAPIQRCSLLNWLLITCRMVPFLFRLENKMSIFFSRNNLKLLLIWPWISLSGSSSYVASPD